MNTHTIVVGIQQNLLKTHEGAGGQKRAVNITRALCLPEQTLTTA